MKQYGKPSAALLLQKTSFFKENELHIKKQRQISDIYITQPKRKACKNCNKPLNDENDFIKDGIGYKICDVCTHLNGAYEDTDKYCKAVYGDDEKVYAANYKVEDIEAFNYRVSSIYHPKAEFLYTSLKSIDVNPNVLSYLDFGSGTGYFVSALKKIGMKNVAGTEVSKSQVDLGNKMIGADLLLKHELEDSCEIISNTTANVISMIGVLEHLQEPRNVMKSISENNNIEYVFISVPVYSLSVYLEILSPMLFHRHLHGGHTHLYTEKSLEYLSDEFNMEKISEWWFGADMVDLYRSIYVKLEEIEASDKLKSNFGKIMKEVIDPMQLELDKKNGSSEVHLLLRKKKS